MFIDALRSESLRVERLGNVRASFSTGQGPRRSASLAISYSGAEGQISVWNSGKCDLQIGPLNEEWGSTTHLSEPDEVTRVVVEILERLADGNCGGHPEKALRGIRIYLDDERSPPEGWFLVRWPEDAIAWLKTGRVDRLSLDHDLGNDKRGTGYDALLWIEEAVATTGFVPPKLSVHSANTSARQKMELAIRSIDRLSSVG